MKHEEFLKLADKLEALADSPIDNRTIQELYTKIVKEATANINLDEINDAIASMLDEIGETE